MSQSEAYRNRIKELAREIKAWFDRNPGKQANIQFNFPSNVAVIHTIRSAWKMGLITCDREGQRLLDQCTMRDDTVMMLRCALEILFVPEEKW